MRGVRFLVAAAAFVVVVAGMRAAESLLIPFLLAIFLAVIGAPPVFWLQRKGCPKGLAVLLVVFALLGLELGMAALVGTSLNSFSQSLPFYQERLQEEAAAVLGLLDRFGLPMPDRSLVQYIDPGAAMRLVTRILSGLGGVLTNTFLIILTVVFILLEASSFPGKLRAAFSDVEETFGFFDKFVTGLNRYTVIKTLVSLATGAVVAAWLAVLGVDFPLLWGMFAFLFNYVPNIGSIISAVPPVLLAFIQFGPGRALLVAAGFVAVNMVFGNLVEPRYMGRRLGLSTLVVFISLVFWGWVLGPVGMLLSVPLTMTLKIALESSDEMRWLAVLLGPESAGENTAESRTA
ncbi:MAG: hypothetical protein C0617_06330 [Desulfuromonas sp.]|nr:MAG: hypothetical protein C0617_06330 [Desulfuromonas sp.]